MGVPISKPDVNRGDFRFVADTDKSIIYGLGAIKGLGEGPVEALVEGRNQGGPFTDLYDLCERVDARKVNKRAIEALIGSGALDDIASFEGQSEAQQGIDYRRALLMANHEDAVRVAEQIARNLDGGLSDLFGEGLMTSEAESCRYNHFQGLRRIPFKERLRREKETLGLYLTGHPIDLYRSELKHISKSRIRDLRVSNDELTIVGLIVAMRTMRTRTNDLIAFVTLDDGTGRTEVSVFADLYEANHAKLHKDNVIVVKGATSLDDFTGGIRMRASEITDFVEARARNVKRLKLRLLEDDLGINFTDELAQLLQPYKEVLGSRCPVSIAYVRAEAEAEVTLGESWRVSPSDDLIQNLQDRYGTETVMLDY